MTVKAQLTYLQAQAQIKKAEAEIATMELEIKAAQDDRAAAHQALFKVLPTAKLFSTEFDGPRKRMAAAEKLIASHARKIENRRRRITQLGDVKEGEELAQQAERMAG